MIENESPKNNPLIEEAAIKRQRENRERLSIEEAKDYVPELREKTDSLLASEEDKQNDFGDLRSAPEQVAYYRLNKIYGYKEKMFEVPSGGEETVIVRVAKGDKKEFVKDSDLRVHVEGREDLLRIGESEAFIESVKRDTRPKVPSSSPLIGPGSEPIDTGPVEFREINMDDYYVYSDLLDHISEFGVENK